MTDEELRQNIRSNLIALRQKRGLTQLDIAILIDKKPTTVATWEQGKSLPDLQTLYRLSKFYQVSLEFMYEHTEKR